jgi:hypothetical protein
MKFKTSNGQPASRCVHGMEVLRAQGPASIGINLQISTTEHMKPLDTETSGAAPGKCQITASNTEDDEEAAGFPGVEMIETIIPIWAPASATVNSLITIGLKSEPLQPATNWEKN